jgi:hypothetical protein
VYSLEVVQALKGQGNNMFLGKLLLVLVLGTGVSNLSLLMSVLLRQVICV